MPENAHAKEVEDLELRRAKEREMIRAKVKVKASLGEQEEDSVEHQKAKGRKAKGR